MKVDTFFASDYAGVDIGDTQYYYGYEFGMNTDPERYEREDGWSPWGFYVKIGDEFVYKSEGQTAGMEPYEALAFHMATYSESLRHRIKAEAQNED